MKKPNPLLLLPLLLGLAACSSLKNSTAMKPGQTARQFSLERKQVLAADYLLFLPQGYDAGSARRWPLILFLHGAGERGTNIWLVAKHGPPKIDPPPPIFPSLLSRRNVRKGKSGRMICCSRCWMTSRKNMPWTQTAFI